jgi:hypothetical protein
VEAIEQGSEIKGGKDAPCSLRNWSRLLARNANARVSERTSSFDATYLIRDPGLILAVWGGLW